MDSTNTPESYTTNTSKEDITLEYVDNFRRQFVQLYPHRARLLLCPKNEHGIEKFICTFIRPTKLPFKELYDFQGCATFIAAHLLYEVLQTPLEVPIEVKSPTKTLQHQKGNSFEYSTLLVSLLIGVGYDAYCVCGYAEAATTENDLSNSPMPLASPLPAVENAAPPVVSSYDQLLSKRPYLHSQFLKKQEERKRLAVEGSLNATKSLEKLKVNENKHVTYKTHCWVMVLPPKRDINAPIFIEPSTGVVLQLDTLSYFRIEAVWNDVNYWVNMQELPEHTKLSHLSYVLNDNTKWEPIFIDSNKDDISESLVLKCPPSWVLRLGISKESYDSRFPGGAKSTWYKMCHMEQYAMYHRSDGMLTRITVFKDMECTKVVETTEIFANRKDYLEQRILEDSKVCECFGKGRASGLQDYIIIKGQKRELRFWQGNRIDGLIKREEFFGKKIAETYSDRDDHMNYRSVVFSEETQSTDSVKLSDGETTRAIKKLTQKYERNNGIPADENVQKISFLLNQKKIQITYHRADGRITASSRIYTKDGKAKGFQVDPFSHKPNPRELFEDFQNFSAIERDCIQELRDTEREVNEIIQAREKEEKNIELLISVYEMKPNKFAKEPERQEKDYVAARDRSDALAVFMHIADDRVMTKELALQIKEATLKALKERLIQKANLIQSRMDKETQFLNQQQANYHRSKDVNVISAAQGTGSDAEMSKLENSDEFEQFKHETMFRIHILEQRLARHEKLAIEKFQELDSKITNDPRLTEFLR